MTSPTYPRLRTLFQGIAASTLAAGCGLEDPYDRKDFEADACAETTITPEASIDFVALRTIDDAVDPPSPPVDTPLFGTACATATDPVACQEALASIPPDAGFSVWSWFTGMSHLEQYVFTGGDEVGVATELDGLSALFGSIDTAAEARIIEGYSGLGAIICAGNNVRFVPEGIELLVTWGSGCGEGVHEGIVLVSPDGTVELVDSRQISRGDPNCAVGRLTDGARPCAAGAPRTVGEHLARMASLEGAAVFAFRRLAAEMKVLGAPDGMVRRALDAARDEQRHVAMVGAAARRFGEAPAKVSVGPLPLRGRLEVALENAREGMVRETYGALAATYQAAAAKDGAIARMFASIAEDETRHAALSIDFGRFLEATLTAPEREAVARARDEAARSLPDDVGVALEPDVRAALGIPSPGVARALAREAFPAAWG